jgi:alpha-L-fucosidase
MRSDHTPRTTPRHDHLDATPLPRRDFLRATGAALGALMPRTSPVFEPPSGLWRTHIGGPAHTAADRMAWWREARFGMFVHFGLYSMLAGEWQGKTDYGEWIRNNAKIPIDEYNTLIGRFNPTRFDADALARQAAAAGMKYLVITTKHHDGFCLWPTAQTRWSVPYSPYRRDLMRDVADACRAHGVKPCWYHSIMDWHHPDYLPRRDWEVAVRPATGAGFTRYVRFLKAQVEELLTQYGDIGVMWFDGEWESTWTKELGASLLEHVHSLQPDTLVNSRVGPQPPSPVEGQMVRPTYGDFGTPEQKIPDRGVPGVDWESCITMNGNWGFNRADTNWKSVSRLVELLVETSSKGGNLLLNVGPDGSGATPLPSVERLQGLATWMRVHRSAIHGTSASPFEGTPFRATRAGNRLHCFLHTWPTDTELLLPGVQTQPTRAFMMGAREGESLSVRRVDRGLVVTLPAKPSDSICSVLTVEMPTPIPSVY